MVNLWATYRLLRSLEKSMEFPRMRGGDPVQRRKNWMPAGVSPHARG